MKKSEHPYLENYTLGLNGKKVRDNQKSEILFIERCIAFLKPGSGRMAIVLPDGILTNSSLQYVRDFIMEKTQILAIVSLPEFAFAHFGAGVKSSIVFVRRKGKKETLDKYKIFMAIAAHIGYEATGKRDPKNDLLKIHEEYKKTIAKGLATPEVFFVWSDELQDRFDPFFYRPFFKNLLEAIANNKKPKIALKEAIINSIAGDWGEDPVDFELNSDYELCYVLRSTNFHNNFNLDFSDVAQRYIKKAKVKQLALKKGDILIEKSGGSPVQPVGRLALIDNLPFDKPVIFSNFLQKMEANRELFLPEYVFVYLQALYKAGYMNFIQNQTTGIKNLRLNDFFKILVINPGIAEQKAVALKAIKKREEAKALIEEAKAILASIDNIVLGELGIELEKSEKRQPTPPTTITPCHPLERLCYYTSEGNNDGFSAQQSNGPPVVRKQSKMVQKGRKGFENRPFPKTNQCLARACKTGVVSRKRDFPSKRINFAARYPSMKFSRVKPSLFFTLS